MNRGARGRRGNNTPRVQATVRGALNQLKSSMHGHENKLRATAPPPINLTPYNTIIVEELHKAENTTAWPRRISNVVDALRVQTGLTGKLRIKLQRVDVWAIPAPGVAGGENPLFQQTPVVAAKFYSLVAAVDNAPSSSSETASGRLERAQGHRTQWTESSGSVVFLAPGPARHACRRKHREHQHWEHPLSGVRCWKRHKSQIPSALVTHRRDKRLRIGDSRAVNTPAESVVI